jgi:hypothetical protein
MSLPISPTEIPNGACQTGLVTFGTPEGAQRIRGTGPTNYPTTTDDPPARSGAAGGFPPYICVWAKTQKKDVRALFFVLFFTF